MRLFKAVRILLTPVLRHPQPVSTNPFSNVPSQWCYKNCKAALYPHRVMTASSFHERAEIVLLDFDLKGEE